MNILFTFDGVRLGRDNGDKPIRKESTVTHHLRRILNERDGLGVWQRFYPNRHGLTACLQGIRNTRTGEVYWHERYQIEDAHKAFNAGQVFYLKA
jgi:hypothetical protein